MTDRRIVLTPRDLQMLSFLATKKAAPIDVLGQRFFAQHANTGAPNKHPVRACARRLTTLAAHGYIKTEELREPAIDGTPASLVLLTPKAAKRTGMELKRVHARHKKHQIETLRACERLRTEMMATEGGHVTYRLEHELMGDEYSGRPADSGGETYASFPDAELTVVDAAGNARSFAVEYVTASYTDEQIQSKHEQFGSYEDVVWVADTADTANRVEQIRGQECTLQ